MNQSPLLRTASMPHLRPWRRHARREREEASSILNRQRCAWLALAVSCAVYLLVSLPRSQAFHPWGWLAFFDLHVYRGAARLVLDGRSIYGGPIWKWAPFTYPPFAAVVLTPLALLPLAVDEVLVTVLGIVALFAILSLALRLPARNDWRREPGWPWRSPLIPLAMAAALWLEPITSTLGYGQINLLIALLVVWDLSRRDSTRSKGALIGIAAGLKLTPLIFVPYLLFSRRPRAAGIALGTFAATIAAGYALLPADSARFWGDGLFLNPQRVGGSYVPANQSLRGLILRLDPSLGSGRILAIAPIVALAGITLAALASRRGDEAMGFSLCALTGLLVSPVSWTHHWTLAVPALMLLGIRVLREHSRVGLAAVGAILLVGYSYLPKLMAKPAFAPVVGKSPGWTIASAPYVLIGCAALAVACVREARMLAADRAGKRAARPRNTRPAPARSLASPEMSPDLGVTRT
jgi:alpha-1,2-mannosyltransferase